MDEYTKQQQGEKTESCIHRSETLFAQVGQFLVLMTWDREFVTVS